MTTVSTILALVTMPFNLWLYGRNLETESLVIPYKQMSFTLILITIPVLFGMLMNWRLPKLSPYITKVE
jgi:predicted Na+-dependent transporter